MNRRQFLKMAGISALMAPIARPLLAWEPLMSVHGEKLELFRKSAYLMGSLFHFDIYSSDIHETEKLVTKVIRRMRVLENLWSVYQNDSEISQLNAAAGRHFVALSEETLFLLQQASEMEKQTNGTFDIGIEPLMRAYGFRSAENETVQPPDDRLLATLEAAIGIKNLEISGNEAVLTHPLSGLDPGGIGCGIALDEAVKILREGGIRSGFINFSGDIYAIGKPPAANSWQVEIQNPVNEKEPIVTSISDCALSTSGAYENRRFSSTSSWGHLIDPLQRRPTEKVNSLSVICSSAIKADCFSTAAYINPTIGAELKHRSEIDQIIII